MPLQENKKYVCHREMPVNSGDPQSYAETPISVKIIYRKKETKTTE